MKKAHEIVSDGVTVWINAEEGLVARFGKLGIDIHRPAKEQQKGGECLFCTHKKVTLSDWDLFVEKVKEYFGIEVGDEYKPNRLKKTVRLERRFSIKDFTGEDPTSFWISLPPKDASTNEGE